MSEMGPVLRAFPLHVRSGAASGIPGGTARCRSRAKSCRCRPCPDVARGGPGWRLRRLHPIL